MLMVVAKGQRFVGEAVRVRARLVEDPKESAWSGCDVSFRRCHVMGPCREV